MTEQDIVTVILAGYVCIDKIVASVSAAVENHRQASAVIAQAQSEAAK